MSNAQVLDLIKKSGIPVGVLGVEYGWLFATGDESKRLFKVFRESCENAVALGCDTLMSAPGQVEGPISECDQVSSSAPAISPASTGSSWPSNSTRSIRCSTRSRC